MKKAVITLAVCALAISASAQSFTVKTKEGKSIGFNVDDVENVKFTDEVLPPAPEITVLNFNSVVDTFTPAEGVLDLLAWPKGVGVFDLSFNKNVHVNTASTGKILLTAAGETVYEADVNSPEVIVHGDVLSDRSSMSIRFNTDGYLAPGAYSLYIPEGWLYVSSTQLVGGTTRAFVIEVPAPEQTVSITPEPGEVEELTHVSFSYANYPVVEPTGVPMAYVYRDSGKTPFLSVPVEMKEDGSFDVAFDSPIKDGGIYSVVIPAATFNLRVEAGSKIEQSKEIRAVYSIEGRQEVVAPKIGDFYYSDGTWSSVLVNKADATPIGVVFYVGAATDFGDMASNYKVKDGSADMTEFHGYVVALRDATDVNGSNDAVQWGPFNNSTCGCSTKTDDFLGYTNTQAILAKAGTPTEDNYPAVYWATVGFDASYPAPAISSGWFLPSAKQLKYIYDNVYFVPEGSDAPMVQSALKQLESLGGTEMYVRDSEYWTSTEKVDTYGNSYRAYYCCFDESNWNPGFVTDYNKNGWCRVRSILVF